MLGGLRKNINNSVKYTVSAKLGKQGHLCKNIILFQSHYPLMYVFHSGCSYTVISLLIINFCYFLLFFEYTVVNNYYAVFVAVDITTLLKEI